MDAEAPSSNPQFTRPNWRAFIAAIIFILERKDPYTRGHSQRVQGLVERLAEALAKHEPDIWNAYLCECASIASLLHDIGKLVVDKSTLLNQTAALTAEQLHELIDHPYEGALITANLFPQEIVFGILQHHERWDGKMDTPHRGYPFGTSGTNISPIARAIKICDAYDAMTTLRSYSIPIPKELAVRTILDQAGAQFDPNYARIFAEEVTPQL